MDPVVCDTPRIVSFGRTNISYSTTYTSDSFGISILERYYSILRKWFPNMLLAFFVNRLNYPSRGALYEKRANTPHEGAFLTYLEIEELQKLMPGQDTVASAKSWEFLANTGIPVDKSIVSRLLLPSFGGTCSEKKGLLTDYFKSIMEIGREDETGREDKVWQQHEFNILKARLGSLEGLQYLSLLLNAGKETDIIHIIGNFAPDLDTEKLKRELEGCN